MPIPTRRSIVFALLALAALAAFAPRARAQSLLERTPNVSGDWVGVPGTLHFNFMHRFTAGDAPTRKVTSSPTFLVAVGLPRRMLVGFNYATNSDVAARYPNEWEPLVRWAPFEQEAGQPFDLGAQAGYNVAARSTDAELSAGRRVALLRVRGAVRWLSNAYDLGASRTALAGGGVLSLGRYLAISGDYAAMLDRPAGYENVWSGALQLAIPYSPHTFSLQATNANTATLQGASAARGHQRRYGFEFTIPITLRRYLPRHASPPPVVALQPMDSMPHAPRDSALVRQDSALVRHDTGPMRDSAPAPAPVAAPAHIDTAVAAPDSVASPAPRAAATTPPRRPVAPAAPATAQARMRQLTFSPARLVIERGTTITWTNRDPLPHTITADDGSWDSGVIEPGKTWRRRFDRPGTWTFHCTPHPFMKGVVVVR